MILRGARIALNARESVRTDVTIVHGRIVSFGASQGPVCDLSGYLLLPGLINAHDHLEFALFPRLGRGPYPNATIWARDIHRPSDSPIREHLCVPKRTRLFWGGVKNLLSGVTLVAHHNPFDAGVFNQRFPVRVLRRYGWAHSLRFSPDLRRRFARTLPDCPFIVHAAEGTDDSARQELLTLSAYGVLDRRTVIVHGVALDAAGLELMRRCRAALVWCPTSNLFTLGRTVRPEVLRSGVPVALGTDSPITAAGDLADEIAAAYRRFRLPADEIYPMVTTGAAQVLRLGHGHGSITQGGVADFVGVPDVGQTPSEALLGLRPRFVMIGGRIRLVSASLAGRIPDVCRRLPYAIRVHGRGHSFTDVPIPQLHSSARAALEEPLSLGGKAVLV